MMDIRVLQYFLAVAETKNVSKASEKLHITQPTLSRQLSQLEDELGTELFQRAHGSRNFTLTSKGLLLKRRAEEILELTDKTVRELSDHEETIEGCISIGSGDLSSLKQLTALCLAFRKQYPRVSFDFCTSTADHIKEKIEEGLLDIGLLLEPIDVTEYSYLRLPWAEKWVALLRARPEFAEKHFITAKELSGLPLLLPTRLGVKNELRNWFGKYYEQLDILGTSNLPASAVAVTHAGAACALVIDGTVSLLDKQELTALPLAPELTASCVMAWRRGKEQTPAMLKFIKFIHQSLNSIE